MPATARLQRRIGVPNCDLPVAGMARSYTRERRGCLRAGAGTAPAVSPDAVAVRAGAVGRGAVWPVRAQPRAADRQRHDRADSESVGVGGHRRGGGARAVSPRAKVRPLHGRAAVHAHQHGGLSPVSQHRPPQPGGHAGRPGIGALQRAGVPVRAALHRGQVASGLAHRPRQHGRARSAGVALAQPGAVAVRRTAAVAGRHAGAVRLGGAAGVLGLLYSRGYFWPLWIIWSTTVWGVAGWPMAATNRCAPSTRGTTATSSAA